MEQPISPIAEIYQQIIHRCLDSNEQSIVFTFIQNAELDTFINESIERVESITQNLKVANELKANQIKTIAYTFLKKFNKAISVVTNEPEKVKLKLLLAKIAKGIVFEIHQQAPSHASLVRKVIEQGFEQAVEIEGYDRKDFENYFQINYTDISNVKVTVTREAEFSEYLIWNEKKGSLQKLYSILHNDYFCLKSKNEFESLFDVPPIKDLVKWDGRQTDLLLLLFNGLYENGYITLKGGKGLWKVVKGRFVDFDKNSLDFDMAKRLNLLKGKKPLKPALVKDVEKILNYIKS